MASWIWGKHPSEAQIRQSQAKEDSRNKSVSFFVLVLIKYRLSPSVSLGINSVEDHSMVSPFDSGLPSLRV